MSDFVVLKRRFVNKAFVALFTGILDWKPQVAPLDVHKVKVAVGPESLVADVALKETRLWVLLDDVLVQGILAHCLQMHHQLLVTSHHITKGTNMQARKL